MADPQGMMRTICALLGIPMRPELTQATFLSEPVRASSSDLAVAADPGQVIGSRVGSFRDYLEPAEIAVVEGALASQLEACGYDLTTEGLPITSTARSLWRANGDLRFRLLGLSAARAQAAWRGRTLSVISGAGS